MLTLTTTHSAKTLGRALADDPEEAAYALLAMAQHTEEYDMVNLRDCIAGLDVANRTDLRVYLWELLQAAGGPPDAQPGT